MIVIGPKSSAVPGLLSLLFAVLFCGSAAEFPPAMADVQSEATSPSTPAITTAPSATAVSPSPAPGNPSGTTTNAAVTSISMDTLDDTHKLAVGDRLSFRIVEDQDPPVPLVITDSGQLEIPYLGRFPAKDKTCKQLALELKTELEKEYYYHATVIIAVDQFSRSRGRVYLMGKIRMPGPMEIPSDEVFTLSKAVMRAGGLSDFADDRRVQVTRKNPTASGGKQVFLVNLNEIITKSKTDKDLLLEPEDLIYIPSRLFSL